MFLAGPGRSGTTAFADYMNQHPQILLCRERYKFVKEEVTPAFFTPERITNFREAETNLDQRHEGRHIKLVLSRDAQGLRWVGDKAPGYEQHLPVLQRNNPGAHFMIMYRPIEDVVESYDARSKNLDDRWLGGKDGVGIGIDHWNRALRETRAFVESNPDARVFIVDYEDFFEGEGSCVPLIENFLSVEFDDSVRRSWEEMSSGFEGRRRNKAPVGREQKLRIERGKDPEAEKWVLERIEWQRGEYGKKPTRQEPSVLERRLASRTSRGAWLKIENELLASEIEVQNARARRLEERISRLERRLGVKDPDAATTLRKRVVRFGRGLKTLGEAGKSRLFRRR